MWDDLIAPEIPAGTKPWIWVDLRVDLRRRVGVRKGIRPLKLRYNN